MPEPDRDLRTATNAPDPSIGSGGDETAGALAGGETAAAPAFGPPAAPGEVGTLGPYRVVAQLGRGGMGAVYLATDTRLNRKLALKVMLPRYAANPAAKERFLREARAAASITHDNVVTVYEADERGGVPYIAMQFLQGYPLDEYLRRKGTPTVPQILRLARETAAGLAAAHAIGLVHRDIKPGNLWLEAPDGRVKVLDFGLAKPVDADVELTKSGAVVGTPAYMSPEQARGKKVDARADLFSLGAVLYRLCTGRLPFAGETTMAVLMALGTEEPTPVRELNPAVPEPLAALVHDLLAKNPEHRPQTADEVVRRVRSIIDGIAGPADLSTSQPQVVYVPIQVTALPPESGVNSVFADLTESESLPPEAVPTAKPVRGRPGGKGMWVAAGLAALLAAAVVGGVIIIIENKDGTKTKIEVPDGSTVTIGKDGKTVVVKPPGDEKTDPAAKAPAGTSPEKQAELARLLFENKKLTHGITVEKDGKLIEVRGNALPAPPFRVKVLTFFPNNDGTLLAEDIPGLAAFTDLEQLALGKFVTDDGLASLRSLPNLRRLAVEHRDQTTPAGAAVLRQFPKLEHLFCPCHADWLKALDGMPALRSFWFHQMFPSPEVAKVLEQFPNLTELTLSDTDVKEDDARRLTGLKSLRLLCLRYGGGLTPEQQREMEDRGRVAAKVLPRCEVRVQTSNGTVVFNEGADRAVAEWVLTRRKGEVYLLVNGRSERWPNGKPLPGERFELESAGVVDSAVGDDDMTRFAGLPKLTGLTLHTCNVTDAGLAKLTDVPALTYLNLERTKITDAGLPTLKKGLPKLNTLGLSDNPITDDGLRHLHALTGLKELTVRNTKVTAKGLDAFHAAVPECKITHDGGVIEPIDADRKAAEWVLSVGGTVRVKGRETDIKAAAELPKDRLTLLAVNLYGKPVTDEGLANLKGLPGLTNLELRFTQITAAGLVHLKDLTGLTYLALNGKKMSDDGLVHLKDLTRLTELKLPDTPLAGVGLAHLKNLTALARLDLPGTGVTDAGLTAMKCLTGLTELNVRKSWVTAKGLADFHAAVPGCRIEHDGGVIEPIDVDRKAAEWVLSLGGSVRVNGGDRDIKAPADLPKDRFTLHTVDLNKKPVTDAGLAALRHCAALRQLHITSTQVTDTGLAHLKDLKELTQLWLYNTAVTDAGLATLKDFSRLQVLNVGKTKVTPKGVADFHAAVPGCRIEYDGGVIEPKK